MRLLVLGGTKFLGRAVVESGLARGHAVTIFNRGETNPALFPEVERLRGDRGGDLGALEGREWDAVVDPSGYVPDVVRRTTDLLRASVGHYTFVSSLSVYASFARPADEASPVADLGSLPADELLPDYSNYGPLKALCEEVVQDAFPGRALHVRAGLLVGPHDPTGRFTYWPHRIARGGEVLAPGPPDRPVQLVDVRDLADWMVASAEAGLAGTFNAASAPFPQRELLGACAEGVGGDASFTYVDEEWLVEREVGQWMELPVWVARSDREWARFLEADTSRAAAAGLVTRPWAETARATLEEAPLVEGVGLTPEREAELLAAWHGRGG